MARCECGKCSTCRARAWKQANPERARELNRKSRAKNLESARRSAREYNERNRERIRENLRRYNEVHRERQNARAREYHQLKARATVERVDRLVVLERDDGVCGICGEDVDPMDFHVDHIVPVRQGGEHSYANVQTAHPACNWRKNRLAA